MNQDELQCFHMFTESSILAMPRIRRIFPFIILFLVGSDFVVPVDVSDPANNIFVSLPFWAQKIEIVHGLFLKEFLLILYLVYFLIATKLEKISLIRKAKEYSILISTLSFVGVVSALVNMQDVLDIMEALRLLLLAAFFVLCVYWAKSFGQTFLLRSFLIGAIASTTINLYFTFSFSWRTIGVLPMLLGQNGPGSALGFMMGLGAWLFLLKEKRIDSLVAIIFSSIALFAIMISFSKLGMLMCFCGIIAWGAVIIKNISIRNFKKVTLFALAIIIGSFIWTKSSSTGNDVLKSAQKIYYLKLGAKEEGIVTMADTGDRQRLYYFYAVGEIFLYNPIFGVSYSGFRDAVSATSAFSTGYIDEDETDKGSNPHNSFLYYISANGFPGLIIVSLLFAIFLLTMKKAFHPYGKSGIIIWICIGTAAFIFGNTTIGLFNTHIMYLPAAVAFSILRKNMRQISQNPS